MELLIIFILILINGIFALSEIAFVSSRKEYFYEFSRQGKKNAVLILKLMDQPEKLLSSVQVGITIIGIISGMYSGLTLAADLSIILKKIPIISPYAYAFSLSIIVILVTYLSIVFGELVPKSIALKKPEKTLLFVFPFIKFFSYFTYPIVSFLSFSTQFILKLLRIRKTSIGETEDPVKEILGMAQTAVLKNKIDSQQANIIANTVKIKELKIKNIMVHKKEMKFLSTDMTLNQALVEAHMHHHTRYPLMKGQNRNEILGYVNFKDIINAIRINPMEPCLQNICRPVLFIHEHDKASEVLKHLIKSYQHIAIVKDSNNELTGMISLENMLEIIVGEIHDEYDILPDFLYNITDHRFLAGGGVLLSKLHTEISNILPKEPTTLSQWLIHLHLKELKIESLIHYHHLTFEIRKMSRSKINEVIINLKKI